MAIPVFTVEDLKDVRRLDGNVQFIDNPDFPVFFFVASGSSQFFFINIAKFLDFETATINALVVETVSASEFSPPSTYRRIVAMYVEPGTEKIVVEYDDQPVS